MNNKNTVSRNQDLSPTRDLTRERTSGLKSRLLASFNRLRGVSVETDLGRYWKSIDKIHSYRKEKRLGQASDSELQALALSLGRKIKAGFPLASATLDLFALVSEASRRAVALIPHDVQMIAGLAMAEGKIAELPTGEGKTLAAVFPASLRALTGHGVHILTFNDYLARRDAAWMGPIFRLLGITVGFIQERMSKTLKREAYACDVTYATAKEAGFDFLRDQLVYDTDDLVQRPFHMAIVDEADSILIDEARVPLVISGAVGELNTDAEKLAPIVHALVPGLDYETDNENRNIFPTESGIAKLEHALACGNLYAPENDQLLAAVHCALLADVLLRRDIDYIVRNGRVEIVDEFTGRVMDKRHWPDGLQAAVEAKENVLSKSEGRILGSITLQHFFRLYPHLSGMTATAHPSASEIKEFYQRIIVIVPSHRPCIREDHPDAVYTHKDAKWRALLREIKEVHASGRPILVGTLSVMESEELAAELRKENLPCQVLNAKNDEREAEIIADAGKPGALTISTNMAGRGTDIKLGGKDEKERDRIVALGGLYVIGTNRHESLRIDQQLRGRAGRQGDPGSSRFFISFEDNLFLRYGLQTPFIERHGIRNQNDEIDDPIVRNRIVHSQRIIEGQNFHIRKSLWRFSSLIENQRRLVSQWRGAALRGASEDGGLEHSHPEIYQKGLAKLGPQGLQEIESLVRVSRIDGYWADHLAWLADLREGIHLVSVGGQEPIQEFETSASEVFRGMREDIDRSVTEALSALFERNGPIDRDAEGLRGPSSTWTYLVNEDQFGWGIELIKGKNIGAAAIAASWAAPLFLLHLWIRRAKKPRPENGE